MPETLRAVGMQVEVHDDHFAPDARDEEWLGEAGRRGWVALTKDERIRRRPLEREAIMAFGVRAFVLTAKGLKGIEMANAFIAGRRRMEALARKRKGPFVAGIARDGGVKLLFPPPA